MMDIFSYINLDYFFHCIEEKGISDNEIIWCETFQDSYTKLDVKQILFN